MTTNLLSVIEQLVGALEKHAAAPMDWACAECRPNSDMLKDGFQCSYHSALAAGKQALEQTQAQERKGLMWSTVAMQERHDQRIGDTIATLEKIKQEQSARYQPVKESFWWRVRIGNGTQTIGRCYTEIEAQRLAAELQRAFNDGAFCVEKVVCSGDLIGATHPQATEPAPTPTTGMNIAQRILHVGGRNNAAGYVEFGSIQAVEALVRQVLRDLPAPSTAGER